jgi:anti-sigma factor RsiW
VLDLPSETDTELKPKRAAPFGGVGESVRHLSYEDLEAYLNGRFPPARLDYCLAHLDSCEACRAELEDLRTLKSEAAGFARPESLGRELERRRKRRTVTLVQTAAVAIIFVAVASPAIWWGRDRLLAKKRPAAATVTQIASPPLTTAPTPALPAPLTTALPPALSAPRASFPTPTLPPPVATAQPRDTRPAGQVSTQLAGAKPGVAASVQHGNSQPPTDLSRSREPAPMSTGAPPPNKAFALLSPFGEAIAESRPEFHWTPLAGAVRYSVAIVDERLHPVQHSRAVRTTSWRPRRPLRRGHTYLWQVTATLRGGSTVVASGPSSPGALLRISPK